MRRPLFALLLGLALAATGTGAHAQAVDPNTPVSSSTDPAAPVAPAADGAAVAPPSTGSGLPEYAPPPATLRAYWHLFAAFAIAWALLFGYALSLGRRFSSVEREIQRLRGDTPD